MSQVFISWTGKLGKKIAEYLKSDLFKYGGLEPWISSQDITSGNPWFQETSEALNNSNYGVVCLTPGASKKPWINFEIGWLYGKLENCKIITFGEDPSNPLACLQKRDGFMKETWYELLRDMIPIDKRSNDEINLWLNDKYPNFKKIVDYAKQSPYEYYCHLDQQFAKIHDAMDGLKKNPFLEENILFQKIILKSYADVISYSTQLDSIYSIPASEYPKYLIHLQETIKPKPIVKAIALVDVQEGFWKLPMGTKIMSTSHEENERIFVFTKPEDFQSYYKTLYEHARKYKVYAISYNRLYSFLGELYTKDFSIITISNNHSILAMYDDELVEQKNIAFVAKISKIDEYSIQFDLLKQSNFLVKIDKSHEDSEKEIINISNRIFAGLTPYPKKWVEMSEYIDVMDYDKHEEKHEYYREMTEKMIKLCQEHSLKYKKNEIEMLEFGAGTGIFTMKLINNLGNLKKLDAIEVDWHCYKLLEIKRREFKKTHDSIEINLYHKDSRDYDPPGKFDYIFSAFADHHIKKADKSIYFENVKKNLNPGGLMIVGDEFLREHDPDNSEEKEQALRAYHNHIIEKAKEQGQEILAMLEQQALISGLQELGDFKVSCHQYEEFLRKAGFEFQQYRIGPLDRNDIGGVYVYTAWLPEKFDKEKI